MRHLPKVLIVEDESSIAELISVNLRHNGMTPIWAEDGESAQREIDAVLPDVILLDWMLPGQSGLALAKKWRADPRTKSVPIIMLTARGDEPDKVSGLNSGADDYITKPFNPKILVAKVQSLLDRVKNQDFSTQTSGLLEVEGIKVNLDTHKVYIDEVEIELSKTEFDLLKYFLEHESKICSRNLLLDEVWGIDVYVEDRIVDTYVKKLRKYLGKKSPTITPKQPESTTVSIPEISVPKIEPSIQTQTFQTQSSSSPTSGPKNLKLFSKAMDLYQQLLDLLKIS